MTPERPPWRGDLRRAPRSSGAKHDSPHSAYPSCSVSMRGCFTLTGRRRLRRTRLALCTLPPPSPPVFPRRVWVVELASYSPIPHSSPFAVAAALGVREAAGNAHRSPRSAPPSEHDRALLVLDNCEHLRGRLRRARRRLLAACPTLRILATSREAAPYRRGAAYRVPPLALPEPDGPPDAVRARPRPGSATLRRTGAGRRPRLRRSRPRTSALVAAICARLDGIPLALELAAARVRVLSARTDPRPPRRYRFRLLTGGSRVAPTRQQTLRAALDWSDALLTSRSGRGVPASGGVHRGVPPRRGGGGVCRARTPPRRSPRNADPAGRTNSPWWTAADGDGEGALQLARDGAPVRTGGQLTGGAARSRRRARAISLLSSVRGRAAAATGRPGTGEPGSRASNGSGATCGRRCSVRRSAATPTPGCGWRRPRPLLGRRGDHLAEGRRWLEVVSRGCRLDAATPARRMRAFAGAGRLAYLQGEYAEAERLCTESLALAHSLMIGTASPSRSGGSA